MADSGDPPRREFPDLEDLDRRPLGDWVSRWRSQPTAWRQILAEVAYVLVLLLVLPVGLVAVYVRFPNELLGLEPAKYAIFSTFAYACIGGPYGGEWNSDRLIWRIIIPFLSGGVTVAVIALAVSGLLPLIDASRLRTSPAVLGLSILTGYFSDVALGALARLARRLFGTLDEPGHKSAETAPTPADSLPKR